MACKDVKVVLKNGGEKIGIVVGQVCEIPLESQVVILYWVGIDEPKGLKFWVGG